MNISGWKNKKIKSIGCNTKNGAAFKPSDFADSGFPVIHKGDVQPSGLINQSPRNSRYVNIDAIKKFSTSVIDDSYLVVSLRDLIPTAPQLGLICRLPQGEKAALAQGTYAFQLKGDDINADYLIQLSNSEWYRRLMKVKAVGSTQIHLRSSEFFQLEIPVPPIKEQQKIAKILSTWDDAIEKLESLIELKKKRKKGLMQQLLTGKKRFDGFSDEWKTYRLENICIKKTGLKRGPFGGALKKEFFVEEGIAVYEQRNAIYSNNDTFRYYINDEKFEELKAFEVLDGDMILSCSGTIGRISYINSLQKRGVINQALMRIRLDTKVVDPIFFLNLFRSEPFQNKISDSTQGGAMKNMIGMPEFKKLKLILPSLEEQKRVSNIFSSADLEIDQLENKLKYTREQKKGLMQQLLTGKKRVKID